jgi:hypothetical protein
VTSHVEVITADVIKAEITKLEAELAGHNPDDGSRGRDRPCCDTQSHVVSELVEEVRHMSKT